MMALQIDVCHFVNYIHVLWWHSTRHNSLSWVRFLSLARSKLRLCSANHRPGYWSNLPCDWPNTAWAYSEQETENGPRSLLADCLSSHPWGRSCRGLLHVGQPYHVNNSRPPAKCDELIYQEICSEISRLRLWDFKWHSSNSCYLHENAPLFICYIFVIFVFMAIFWNVNIWPINKTFDSMLFPAGLLPDILKVACNYYQYIQWYSPAGFAG